MPSSRSLMRLFVYGTLMQAGANHRVLTDLGARLIGIGRTFAPRTLVDLGPYPALLACNAARDASAVRVCGELYVIDDADAARALEALDEFEGCPDLYTRELVTLEDGDAWTYVLSSERGAADALDNKAPKDDGSGQLPG